MTPGPSDRPAPRAARLSLQARLLLGVLGVVAAVWLAAAFATWRDARHELDELLDSHLAQAAALLIAQDARTGADDDEAPLPEAPLLHRYGTKTAFQVWHEQRLALRSANAPATPLAAHARGFDTRRVEGVDWRVFVARGADAHVRVMVGERLDSRAEILGAVARGLLAPLAVALPLLALLLTLAVRSGLAPLRRLREAVARREPQALDPIALVPGTPAEVVPLVAALNALFARIAALLEAERRFTADAAHELRTPLAAIRTQAQVALAAGDDAPARRHALEATLAGCDRATRLVEQLLMLARLDAAAPRAPSPPIDLAALTRRVVAEIAPAALDRGQQLAVEAPEPCPLAADEALTAVLLRNLVDNAVRYSPQGARIAIAVGATAGGGVQWRIDDSGPGLAPADAARLGERFFRLLGSGEGGSGLGFSIVRRIAAVQGAQVRTARSPTLGGLAVIVHWSARGPSRTG